MKKRVSLPGVNEIFPNRWSPRAMSGEQMSKQELMQLFEAARWSPSSYNNQPWRFLYAMQGMPQWKAYFDLLVPINQSWCQKGAALIVMLSRKCFEFNNEPSRTHSFDAGSAWMSLALQGSCMGLVIHCLEGFDYDQARRELAIPDNYDIEAMCVIGKPGRVQDLPVELQKREEPSDRKPLADLVGEGTFAFLK